MLSRAAVFVCVLAAWTRAEVKQLDLFEGDECRRVNGSVWTCTRAEVCDTAKDAWRRGVRPEVCSFQGRHPVICCEPDQQTPPVELKSEQMCKKYGAQILENLVKPAVESGEYLALGLNPYQEDYCVLEEPSPLGFSGGENALPGEFPHMALIGVGDKGSIRWVCGGSLISEKYILSAAHCTHTTSGPVRWARLAEYDTETRIESRAVDYEIVEWTDHPGYVNTSVYHDIALYRLSRDVKFNEFVRPACLHTRLDLPHTRATASGWGRTEAIGRPSPVLQKVKLTLSTAEECRDSYQSVVGPKLAQGILGDSQLCAGDLIGGQDACSGDSGGPLQLRMNDPYCMFGVIGVVSFGPKFCGDGSRPGVYTRVSHYVPWIESIVWP